MAVDSVLRVVESHDSSNVDLNDIRVVKKLGATQEETELVDGLVFTQPASKSAGGPTRVENAKIALIQFCVSPPKTDVSSLLLYCDVIVSNKGMFFFTIHHMIDSTG